MQDDEIIDVDAIDAGGDFDEPISRRSTRHPTTSLNTSAQTAYVRRSTRTPVSRTAANEPEVPKETDTYEGSEGTDEDFGIIPEREEKM